MNNTIYEKIYIKLKELLHYLKLEFIDEQKKRLAFFLKRPRMILWIAICFFVSVAIFGMRFFESWILAIIEYTFIFVVMFRFGEFMIRNVEDVRHIATKKEKEYLLPLFEDVYNTFRKNYNISNNIKLYIIDTRNIDAFSIGANTIVVSRGIIDTMSKDELKAVIAHEFSHIVRGDSQARLVLYIFTSIPFFCILVMCRLLRRALDTIKNPIIYLILAIIYYFIYAIVLFVSAVSCLVMGFGGKYSEYKADKLTQNVGYGNELISALYTLYDIQINDKQSIVKRISDEHPKIAYRIEQLEEVL